MSFKQEFVVTVEHDSRFASKIGSRTLTSFVGDRVTRIEGVEGVDVGHVGRDKIVISRIEYDQLRATVEHLSEIAERTITSVTL